MQSHYRAKYGGDSGDAAENFAEKKFLFEEITQLAKSNDHLKQRVAYIMTDHLLEVLLNDGLERVIAEYYDNMLSPRIDGSTFNKLRMNFDAKLEFFSVEMPVKAKTGISFVKNYQLSADEATILSILHRYRNDMYHRNQVNKDVLGVLLMIYIKHTLDVFAQFASPHGLGGPNWKKLGLTDFTENGMLYFKKAAKQLKKKLLPRTPSVKTVSMKLVSNLETRYKDLITILEEELPSSKDPKVQDVLANQVIITNDLEFSLENDRGYQKILEAMKAAFAAEDHRESAKLRSILQSYQVRALKKHTSNLSYADLLLAEQAIKALSKNNKLDEVLSGYYGIDQKLLIYGDRIIQGSIDFDREVQRQIDIARGK